jgi:hypothetical protein
MSNVATNREIAVGERRACGADPDRGFIFGERPRAHIDARPVHANGHRRGAADALQRQERVGR